MRTINQQIKEAVSTFRLALHLFTKPGLSAVSASIVRH